MCGIVMVGSKSMASSDVARFEKLLYCDVFRGPHSTGVFTHRQYGYGKEQEAPQVDICKDAIEAAYFLDSPEWIECRDGKNKTAKLGNLYVGHNRYATMGAKTAKNAHPFNHGNITLVHNGTLNNQSLLPDHREFDVDSENICHSINKIGAAETIQLLNGAFTLIWFDASDSTLHIIRNDERPFHLAETSTGDWYGASEEDMLMWILTRGKYNPTIKRHFEIEVGVEYIFDAAPGKFSLKEEVKHELPTFRYASQYSGTNGSRYSSQARGMAGQINSQTTVLGQANHNPRTTSPSNSSTGKHDACNKLLKEAGINLVRGNEINFTAHHFGSYSNGSGDQGMVEGYLEDMEEYIEVQAHQCSESMYKCYAPLVGQIASAFRENGVLTIICTRVRPFEPIQIPEITDADDGYSIVSAMMREEEEEALKKETMLNGDSYTQSEWEKSGHAQCGVCSSPVDFEEAKQLEWYNNEPVCETCRDDLYAELAEEEYAKSQQPEPEEAGEDIDWEKRDFTFNCKVCKEPTDLNNEGKIAGHCKKCSPHREVLKLAKEANKNLQPNTMYCHNGCGKEVKNKTFMHKGHAMCPQCWSDLKQKEDATKKANQVPLPTQVRLQQGNGKLVNSRQWKKMSRCHNCGYRIPFKFAQYTLILDDKVYCDKCADKLI